MGQGADRIRGYTCDLLAPIEGPGFDRLCIRLETGCRVLDELCVHQACRDDLVRDGVGEGYI